MQITQAQDHQYDAVLLVLDELAAWLVQRGIRQWPPQFSNGLASGPSATDWRQDRLRSYISAGQTWLVHVNDDLAATFTLADADPDFAHGWPDGPETGQYVYRMAVRRVFAGQGLGSYILDWCSARVDAHGFPWLRLDCHRRNRALQRYYEQRGFERVGTVVHTLPSAGDSEPYTRGSGALYQRPARLIGVANASTSNAKEKTSDKLMSS